jgi:hypothetical protein
VQRTIQDGERYEPSEVHFGVETSNKTYYRTVFGILRPVLRYGCMSLVLRWSGNLRTPLYVISKLSTTILQRCGPNKYESGKGGGGKAGRREISANFLMCRDGEVVQSEQ